VTILAKQEYSSKKIKDFYAFCSSFLNPIETWTFF
jgi:hypothetical protein